MIAALVLVAACAGPVPTPSPTIAAKPTSLSSPSFAPSPSVSRTGLPAAELADPPPPAIQDWLATIGMGFRPLTNPELATVKVTVANARREALAEPPQGVGTRGAKFVWSKIGCLYLGYYRYQAMASISGDYVPPQLPAYLVQLLAPPVKGFPGGNVEVMVIDARTGQPGERFGYGPPVVLGTTCGVTP